VRRLLLLNDPNAAAVVMPLLLMLARSIGSANGDSFIVVRVCVCVLGCVLVCACPCFAFFLFYILIYPRMMMD